jgi:3'(2'), 5'-bisphosphate nucleotidase
MSSAALRHAVVALARQAGRAILEVYADAFPVEYKADDSPLTEADLAAHRVIVAGLERLTPGIPVLSEESAQAVSPSLRRSWQQYWLVDPLDGTREFIKRNDEFTVNIALVDGGVPVLGVVHAPALDELAHAVVGQGVELQCAGAARSLSALAPVDLPTVAISRSHPGADTLTVLAGLGAHRTLTAGSALKFIRLAEGRADLYPRLGPTSEWDTAAGQCLLETLGGAVLDLDGRSLRYNQRESLLNPSFLAVRRRDAAWLPALLASARRCAEDRA